MLFTQSEFGLNTETALLFWKKKPQRLLFCSKLYLCRELLQMAVSPQTNPVKSYWQLNEVDTKGMF